MGLDENKEVIERFFDALGRSDIDRAMALVGDSVTWWIPGTLPLSGTHGKAGLSAVIEAIQKGFPSGLAFTVTGMVAEGPRVAAEVESRGEHANGKTYNNKYHFLFELQEGRFIAVKEYMDTLHLHDLMTP